MINELKKIVSLLLVASIGGVAGVTYYKEVTKEKEYNSIQQRQVGKQVSYTAPVNIPNELNFTAAAEKSIPAVVHVTTFYGSQPTNAVPFDPFRDFFYGDRGYQRPQEASGSGVIISDDGYIVTNNHVVDNADKVEVTLDDKRDYIAKVIGKDQSTDLALLKIEGKGFPFLAYGNSDDVKVGQWVLAVGNPFNLNSTVTAGIISAKARNINILPEQTAIESFIQTDAAVNPGNSGGALINTDGSLIGINSAIASNTGSYAGYSFAIPVNIVKKVMDDLLEYGTVQRGFIGVGIQDVDAKLAEDKGLKSLKGVYINRLTDGGAAADAGLRVGDIITRVENAEVNSTPQLLEQIGRHRPGDKVNFTVVRDGEEMAMAVVLRNIDNNTKLVKESTSDVISMLGAEMTEPNAKELKDLGINNGVKISSLSPGKLRAAGIKEGFIIVSIDNKPMKNKEDVAVALKTKKGGVLIEGVYPNGMRAYYGFGL
jgi:serine protease Do